MAASMLLVHSPLLGPSAWERLVTVAVAAGLEAAVPDLTVVADAPPPRWRTFVGAAVNAAAPFDDVIVVGHSGAGVFVPAIAHELGRRHVASVFVDAVVPVRSGAHRASATLRERVAQEVDGDRLRRWLDWWSDEEVRTLLPSRDDRERLLADMPRLPLDFYEESVPVPDGWSDACNMYLQLSPAYDADRQRAVERGWPTGRLDANHLGVLTDPQRVFAEVRGLLDEAAH